MQWPQDAYAPSWVSGGANEPIPEDRRPPDGCTWFCTACGKWAEDRYGIIGKRSRGWDVSCSVNAAPSSAPPPWKQTETES